MQKRQYDKAILDFNKTIEIRPGHAQAYLGRLMVFYNKRDYDKAWDDVRKAQSLGLQVPASFLKDLREASGR